MAKVVEARIFNLRQEGIASRDNTTSGLRESYPPGKVMEAIGDFGKSISRCMLVLVLDDGREISIIPILQEKAVAFEEEPIYADPERLRKRMAHDPNSGLGYLWDISVEIWPR